MTATAGRTPWARGRFDARPGPRKILFGCMYEDTAIELSTFRPGGRVFCIASAGCTAMRLASRHDVTAVDINPIQLAYAIDRAAGGTMMRGSAERVMDMGRALAPLVGWRSARVREFLDMDDPVAQLAFWHRHLATRRFRFALDALLSVTALRAVYASPFLSLLPREFGAIMRGRMERCFARHPNRTNPYARALLLGEPPTEVPPPEVTRIRFVHADAAGFLESEAPGSYDGFTLSNILDGAEQTYGQRLFAAVRHAAAPGAAVVLRTFGEPREAAAAERAMQDRSMLWGSVDVMAAIEQCHLNRGTSS